MSGLIEGFDHMRMMHYLKDKKIENKGTLHVYSPERTSHDPEWTINKRSY